jgi:hypothetical protein
VTSAQVALQIKDYAPMPITGSVDSLEKNSGFLARVNFLREEPGGAKRLFVNDLNGYLYILDKSTKEFTRYLDFNGFPKLAVTAGLAGGFISFQFDPDYRHNGKFYTIHLEDPAIAGSGLPDAKHFPGLNLSGYSVTPAIPTPGITRHLRDAVLVEWTDTNIANSTFEGTAREILRVQLGTFGHPMGDLIFNPTARRGDPEWRVMYISCGDGHLGEEQGIARLAPQRLDALVGKILRIIPDLNEDEKTSTVSDNWRYRVPNDNPFASMPGARKEIWATGLRNPHRMTWDVDPANRNNNRLIVNVVGLDTWETVDIVHKGANYGYSLREGNEQLNLDNRTSKLPDVDKIPIQIDATKTQGMITPTYPVIQYGHIKEGGDSIAGGFVYRGKAIPILQGKYIFGDITMGRIWYADYNEMIAADDGDPKTMAPIHEMKILLDKPDGTEGVFESMKPIVETAYHLRGGKSPGLISAARVAGPRADIRLGMDAAGELYILSKSDGMIRKIVGAVGK